MKKRKKKPEFRCHCGSGTILRPASEVYKNVTNGDKFIMTCARYPVCNSYVSVHKKTLKPKGTLAGGELRHWRILAHKAFDSIWQNRVMSRTNAYCWMRDKFSLTNEYAHIGCFSEYMCERLINECAALLRNNGLKLPDSIVRDSLFELRAS